MKLQKKSRSVKIAATTFSGLLVLSGCNEEAAQQPDPPTQSEAAIYSPNDADQECSQRYSAQECDSYRTLAQKEHDRDSPKYASQEECAINHDDCRPITLDNGAKIFAPAMLGFMVGAAAGAAGAAAIRAPVPVYLGKTRNCDKDGDDNTNDCSRRRGVYTGRGVYIGNSGSSGFSRAFVSPRTSITSGRAFSSPASTVSVSRGGFGASAGAHGGGGE